MTQEKFELVKTGVDCYKRIRDDIAKAIPFYPIGLPKHSDEWMCLAFRCENCTRLAVWRMDSEEDTITIPLSFEINNVEKLYPLKDDYKSSKYSDGLKVTLPNKYCAVLLEVK